MKILSIVGARPQFIKLAPFIRVVEAQKEAGQDLEHLTLHTGQHYDRGMSDVFFEELEMPPADVNLGVGSASQGRQTAKMLEGIEAVLMEEKPDVLVIFGDTNSTVAGALASSKIHIPVAHIEAGLRSFNRRMPEEINRIVSDHISDVLLAPTQTAMENLEKEGLKSRSVLTGDIMYDAVLNNRRLAERKSGLLERLNMVGKPYAAATLHRAENTNDLSRLKVLLDTLNKVARDIQPIVFPIHPRTRNLLSSQLEDWQPDENLQMIEPVGYLDMLQLVANARFVLSDSGGLQKEAFFLDVPCITLRDETEWVETVIAGANVVAGADQEMILKTAQKWDQQTDREENLSVLAGHPFGKGDAAQKILEAVTSLVWERQGK